jgi:cytochrome c oxidase cbb3-type subunit IV
MDFGVIHGLLTVLLIILFGGIVWWAFSSKQKKRFDEAANLPFAEHEEQPDDKDHPGAKRPRKGDDNV